MKYEEYRQKVIECKKSSMTAQKWCKHEGIKYTTYCTWRKRVLGKEGVEKIHLECGFAKKAFKKRETYPQYRKKVLECRGSGMPMDQWCENAGINYNCYRTWQRRVFEKEEQSAIDKECGRLPREKKDYSLEKVSQDPEMFEISNLFKSYTKEIIIETQTDHLIAVRCGEWTVIANGRTLEDVIRAVKSICL